MSSMVHETAIVEDGVALGDGCRIWHQAHVRSGAVLGTGASLGKNVFIDAGVHVGARCKIQNNVSVYAGVTPEDDVFVGPSAIFTNDLVPRAFLPWSNDKVVPTLICRGASIGAGACIRCGITIGEFAMIAMGSVVLHNVGPYELWAGNPAVRKGWVDRQGNKAEGPLLSELVEPSNPPAP